MTQFLREGLNGVKFETFIWQAILSWNNTVNKK